VVQDRNIQHLADFHKFLCDFDVFRAWGWISTWVVMGGDDGAGSIPDGLSKDLTRSNEAHITRQHIQKLRHFVETRPPQNLSDPRDPWIGEQFVSRLLIVPDIRFRATGNTTLPRTYVPYDDLNIYMLSVAFSELLGKSLTPPQHKRS